MVVATRARYRQRHRRTCHRIDLVVDVIHLEARLEALVHILRAQCQEAGCNRQPVPFFGRGCGQLITGNLLDDKAIEGNVAVIGINDVVAIPLDSA